MRRILGLALIGLVGLGLSLTPPVARPALGQFAVCGPGTWRAINAETITVSSTAIGPTIAKLTGAANAPAECATASVGVNSISCYVDGSTPTASVGHLWQVGERFVVMGNVNLQNMKCIRTASPDAALAITYYVNAKP
jgi:hypothetical protein